ncbi:hypothetical protein NitYY0826_C0169 [Nitratiruptor sp. YY08-26]|uniref:hypothetical protein n=1 Tax=unclassified Nitratiruptor TaxID=2624044 RepID=UPI001916AF00|nr:MULTISPECIES: hypothetical protein [unclassified Nitratiruptor]BCD61330.1 hypothetical protein NitYY0813_C0169 [Nitratiruptor sp. YY08-13]BCD65263.1 hypothetical protein NitYY0826_C0169 [Nitratiruptor sp. YY08-26]
MRYKILVGLLALLLFAGCNQKIYEKKYAKASKPITCLQLQVKNPLTKLYLAQEYKFSAQCPFILRTTSHFVTTCTSAYAKALGSDFDGFLRLELYENKKLLYRNQIDFKGCLQLSTTHKLFQAMRQAMHF